MAEPKDKKLYARIKAKIYRDHPVHSAYRSALLVKTYKQAYGRKHDGSAYEGKKPKTGITRWMKEEWRNQRGEVGYKNKNDIYRPTRRVTSKTPKTFQELDNESIKRARRIKANTGRARFK